MRKHKEYATTLMALADVSHIVTDPRLTDSAARAWIERVVAQALGTMKLTYDDIADRQEYDDD